MLFNSAQFLIFFPIVLAAYYLMPQKLRMYWLLIASYYFYMCWNAKYILLILTSTVITYISGLLLQRVKEAYPDVADAGTRKRRMNLVVALSFGINLGILGYFKYTNFFMDTIRQVLRLVHIEANIPTFDILLPVGISFYTFQALSYTMDVYRGEIYAEHNFCRYALFVSFFPQLVAGPIERSKNLLKQLKLDNTFDYEQARDGFLLMLWGYFLKIVLADRIAMLVDTVYGDPATYDGGYIVVATVLFGVQIYCDFYGYSVIAKGSAEILGIRLMENFHAPYLSDSVAKFWRNWHISLTSWFKDYLYIPLGGSRRGKARKYLNQMIVFLVSGLWHGASLSFVVWGGLNGLYQVIGEILTPAREKVAAALKINREAGWMRGIRIVLTFVMVDFAWLFFRAQTMENATALLKNLFFAADPAIILNDLLNGCGLNAANFGLMILGILVLLADDICMVKKIKLRQVLVSRNVVFRCVIIVAAICAILTFGIWGSNYDAAGFIYFQF